MTEFPASSIDEKPRRIALTVSGFFKIFTVTSVMTQSKPSDPVIRPRKSYPGESKTFPPILTTVPSISTASTPNMLFVVVPYFNE